MKKIAFRILTFAVVAAMALTVAQAGNYVQVSDGDCASVSVDKAGAANFPDDIRPRIYANCAVVVEISTMTDTVVCRDDLGHLWTFNGVEDWELGDGVAMVMFNNGTGIVYDDIIISATFFRVDLLPGVNEFEKP